MAKAETGTTEAGRWHERLEAAQELRDTEQAWLWQPLHDKLVGRMKRGAAEWEHVNPLHEYVDVLMPHLVGERREVRAKPMRVPAGQDPQGMLAFAELLGEQATALGQAIGLIRDSQGRPGELVRAVFNSLWSMGVVLFGFEPPRGLARAAPEPGEPEEQREAGPVVDLDFAAAGHKELHDAGMPFARSIDPRHFLCDPTFKDFSAGQWCAIEYYLSLAEARARWPKYRAQWQPTHASPPLWEDGDSGDGHSKGKRLVRLIDVYLRRPSVVITIADERAGLRDVVERRKVDLGIEGLPVLLLGHEWMDGICYPIPPLAHFHDSAAAENDHLQTLYAAGRKIKSGVIVDANSFPKLAQQLRDGVDNGVYEAEGPFKEAVDTVEVGAIRSEHIELADKNRQSTERSSGMSDFLLGQREPGDPTLGATELRQGHIAMRLAGKVDPARTFEAASYQRLIAIAYAKILLLHGVQLPVDQQRFVAFDANQPVAGELTDYLFEVEVHNRMSSADELNQINNVLQLLPQFAELLRTERKPKLLEVSPLLLQVLDKSRVREKERIIVDLPPQPPAEQMPPEPAQPAPPDPAAQLEQVWAALEQMPEGDPREEELLQAAAGLQAQMEQMQAA